MKPLTSEALSRSSYRSHFVDRGNRLRSFNVNGLLLAFGSVCFFILCRLIFLWFVHPRYVLITAEELYRGTIAHELLRGLAFHLAEYRADDYSGGSLVSGVITAVPFRLLGPTLFALKLTPLLYFSGALFFWVLLLQAEVSQRAAALFSLIFVLSPPSFLRYSVTNMGFHTESVFFTALTLYLFFRIGNRPNVCQAFLFGMVAGISVWFAYVSAIPLASLMLWAGYRGIRWNASATIGCLLGSILGFGPWIWLNLWGPLSGLSIGTQPLWSVIHLRPLPSWRVNGLVRLLGLFSCEDFAKTLAHRLQLSFGLIYWVPVASILWVRRRDWPPLIRFCVINAVVWAIVLQLAGLDDLRYRVVFLPTLMCLLAWALTVGEDLWPFSRWLSIAPIGLGLAALTLLVSTTGAGYCARAKGYSYRYIPPAFGNDAQMLKRYLEKVGAGLSADDRQALASGAAFTLFGFERPPIQLERLARQVNALISPWRERAEVLAEGTALYEAIRMPIHRQAALRWFHQLGTLHSQRVFLGLLNQAAVEERALPEQDLFLTELIRSSTNPEEAANWKRIQGALPSQPFSGGSEPFVEGQGIRFFEDWCRRGEASGADPLGASRTALLRGAGIAYGLRCLTDDETDLLWQKEIFLKDKSMADRAAFTAGQHWARRQSL